MKSHTEREKLLKLLRETPIVHIACKRVGIGTSTYYRWREQDKDFAKAADDALQEGILLINDMAESQLISGIRDRDYSPILFWLKHHHPDYSTRVEIDARHRLDENLTPEQQATVEKALRLAGLPKLETNGKEKRESA